MEREKTREAKLDSKGRPLTKQPEAPTELEAEPGQGARRADQVRVAVRLGVFALALSTQTGCEPEAQSAAVDPRIERAVDDARTAAALSAESADRAIESAKRSAERADIAVLMAQAANRAAQRCAGERAR